MERPLWRSFYRKDRCLKILYLGNEFNLKSGWGVVNTHTVLQAENFGHEVTVISARNATNELPDRIERVHPLLTSISDGPLKIWRAFRDAQNIKSSVCLDNFDLVHILIEPYFPVALFLGKRNMLFHLIGTYSVQPFHTYQRFLYNLALKKANAFVAISEYTKKRFLDASQSGIDVSAIPLGVDYKHYKSTDRVIKQPAFTLVGPVKPRKGHIVAIEAISQVCREYPDAKLYIAGEQGFSQYHEACKKRIDELSLYENIEFVGVLGEEELIDLYHKSIANILPSINDGHHFEGFGLIHLEANACGIPTIGSKECGNESAIIDSETGFLCRQNDVDEIAARMKQLLDDFKMNQMLSWEERCLNFAKKMDWSNYFDKLQPIYRQVASR